MANQAISKGFALHLNASEPLIEALRYRTQIMLQDG